MFLLFAGDNYYPSGGWSDFRGQYLTRELAEQAASSVRCDWWHVVDLSTLSEVNWGPRSTTY